MATIVGAAGGGNWTTGATWVGGIAPTAADDAQLNATSGNVTIDTGAVCRSLDCTGYTGVLTHTASVTLTIGDATAGASNIALKLVAGMTYTLGSTSTSAISFISTSTTQQTVDFGSKTSGNVTYNGSGGSWQLAANHTANTTATVTLTAGTLDTNGKTCSWGFFSSSNSNVRTLTLGASSITLTGSSGNHWDFGGSTNLTFNAGTSLLTFNFTSTMNFSGGSQTFFDVTWNFPGGIGVNYGGSNTFHNFSLVSNTSTFAPLNLPGSGSVTTVTGLFSATASSDQKRIRITSGTPGATATISAGSVTLQNVDFMDVAATGSAFWAGTSVGDELGNSGITFTPARTLYRVGSGGNWSDTNWSLSSGGPVGQPFPLAQDSMFVDANASGSINANNLTTNSALGKNIDFTGFAGIWTGGIGQLGIYGSLTVSTGMSIDPNQSLSFNGRGSHTITTNGKAITDNVVIQAPGGTYTLQDNLTLNVPTKTLTLTIGTLDASSANVTVPFFSSSNSNLRTIKMGSGTWNLTGVGSVWNLSTKTNLTLTPQTSTISIAEVDGAGKTFAGNSLTYASFNIVGGGTGDITITGNNTFTGFTIQNPKVVKFTNGGTTTVRNFTANGVSGSLVTLRSTVSGYPFRLNVSSGYSVSFVDVRDSNASGSTFVIHDAPGGVDSGNNTFWAFDATSTSTSSTSSSTSTSSTSSSTSISSTSSSISSTSSSISSTSSSVSSTSMSSTSTSSSTTSQSTSTSSTSISTSSTSISISTSSTSTSISSTSSSTSSTSSSTSTSSTSSSTSTSQSTSTSISTSSTSISSSTSLSSTSSSFSTSSTSTSTSLSSTSSSTSISVTTSSTSASTTRSTSTSSTSSSVSTSTSSTSTSRSTSTSMSSTSSSTSSTSNSTSSTSTSTTTAPQADNLTIAIIKQVTLRP